MAQHVIIFDGPDRTETKRFQSSFRNIWVFLGLEGNLIQQKRSEL